MATRESDRRFRWALLAITLAGLAIRVTWILVTRQHQTFGGDAGFYHRAANLLADGRGFIQPYHPHRSLPAGDHPPLYTLWLAIPSVLGFRSELAHLLWSAVLGAGTIALVGATGRQIGGARTGLLAAAIAATYPNVWVPDGSLMAETVAMFTMALALYWAYRYWHAPTWPKLAVVGLAAGAGALSRSELVLIVPLMVVPLAVLVPGPTRRDRWLGIGAGALAAVAVMAPWLGYNLSRFREPELLSTQFGLTLSSANCDPIWRGYHKSYFSIDCSKRIERTLPKGLDESQQDAVHRRAALKYVGNHLDLLPGVVAARVGAILGLYHPSFQIQIDGVIEGRGATLARAGMYSFYALALLSVAGAIALRRRRTVPVFPLLVPPVMVLVTVVTIYASTRFRASAEVSLCLLAAVALDEGLRVLTRRRTPQNGEIGRSSSNPPPAGVAGPAPATDGEMPGTTRFSALRSVDTASSRA
ncbi:MAG: ArnT family glycosyltransferase [Acidimicrobiia bacterium]